MCHPFRKPSTYMLALLLTAICHGAICPSHGAPAPAATPPAVAHSEPTTVEEKALKAVTAWLKFYRTGKMHLHSNTDWRPVTINAKDSFAVKFGLAPKGGLGDSTWTGDLELLLEQVAKLDSADAAQSILDVAAIGMDDLDYTREMAPFEVRAIGEKWAKKLLSRAARDEVAKAARGELKVEKARAIAIQAAGIRCLGLLQEASSRQVLEQQLASPHVIVRVNAAEALGYLGEEAGAMALIQALEQEQSDMVLPAIVQALRTLYEKYLPKPTSASAADQKEPAGEGAEKAPAKGGPPESVRLAVRAAIKALGRSTWRADMVIVRLLDDFRSAESVPALITVLERFRDHPEEVQSGKLSGLLQHRVHELLVGMTGAVYPATQPEKWRELWDTNKDKIEVTKKREAGPATTVASGFCGIPVQGTRVLFVLDLSGSMKFPMQLPGTSGGGSGNKGGATRLDFAKRELVRAMDSIAPNAYFNLVTFNGNPKSKIWNKDMVMATEKNRERFRKFVNDLDADGGTNLWSALEEGLKVKSLVYGDRYETNVDEMFVLSDGAPSAGDVLDPIEILRLVKECNRFASLRINTVFISSPETPGQPPMPWMSITPEEMMKRMADQNGGKFVNL
jgi:HEAT repeat protein